MLMLFSFLNKTVLLLPQYGLCLWNNAMGRRLPPKPVPCPVCPVSPSCSAPCFPQQAVSRRHHTLHKVFLVAPTALPRPSLSHLGSQLPLPYLVPPSLTGCVLCTTPQAFAPCPLPPFPPFTRTGCVQAALHAVQGVLGGAHCTAQGAGGKEGPCEQGGRPGRERIAFRFVESV